MSRARHFPIMVSPKEETPLPPAKPKKVTNDDLYRRSTQYRYWSFTASKLADLRVLANKKGLKSTHEKLDNLDPALEETKAVNSNGLDKFPFVTPTEELQIITYYARKCQDLANFFRLPSQVRSTAIVYLYKFYLTHSVMAYHPQHIMYTCLFLAAKVENSFIGINNFSKAIPRTTPDSILQYEYLILQSLRFSLRCHHPFMPLYGFYLDIQDLLPKVDLKRLTRSCDKAREYISESLFTDVFFLFTPPQIALSCLWKSDDILVERYLAKKMGLKKRQIKGELAVVKEVQKGNGLSSKSASPDADPAENESKLLTPQQKFDKLMITIKKCAHAIDKNTCSPSFDEARRISSKIRYCLDPIRYGRRLVKQQKETATVVVQANAEQSHSSKSGARMADALEGPSKRLKTE